MASPPLPAGPAGLGARHRVDVARGHLLPVERARPGRHHPHQRTQRQFLFAVRRIRGISDQQVSGLVEGHVHRVGQGGPGGRAAVAGRAAVTAPGSAARHRVQVPGGHRPAVEAPRPGRRHQHPRAGRDHQVPGPVGRRAACLGDHAADGGATIVGQARRVIPSHRGERTRGRAHPAHGRAVRDVEPAARPAQTAWTDRDRSRGTGAAGPAGDSGDGPPSYRAQLPGDPGPGHARGPGQAGRHQRQARHTRCLPVAPSASSPSPSPFPAATMLPGQGEPPRAVSP